MIENWLQEYAPYVLEIYKQSNIKYEDIKPGTYALALKNGFSGYSGKLLKIVSLIETVYGKSIEIESVHKTNFEIKHNSKFELLENHKHDGPWYFYIYLLTNEEFEEYYNLKSVKERNKWEIKKFGKTLIDYSSFHLVK